MRVVAISGPVGAGKSTLCRRLADRPGAWYVRTQELMRDRADAFGDELPDERRALQAYGDRLDAATAGGWVAEGVVGKIETLSARPSLVVVDAVRIHSQIERLREAFGPLVTHVHLDAPDDTLTRRYSDRGGASGLTELTTYDDVAENETERHVRVLHRDADIAIDTQRCSPADVATRVAAALQLFAPAEHRLVDVLIGAQYGSEGKGNIAFFLAPEYEALVRVGGPNAGHKVPLPTPYTHVHLPSGTRANTDAYLIIGPGSTIDVSTLMREIAECSVEFDRLSIDPQAMIIDPADVAAETSLVAAIGSTGKGGGAAAARRITGRHTNVDTTPVQLARDVPELRPYLRPAADVLDETYSSGGRVLLEGTQGTALSLYHGTYPHVTSRDTTTAGCLAETGIGPRRLGRAVMVTRVYPIRVQDPADATSGPMSQELSWETVAERSGVPLEELLSSERGSRSGKQRRVAEFDWRLLRRAAELNGATDIALTFADYIDVRNRDARRYDQVTGETLQFIEDVESVAGVPVSLLATRFDVRGVIDRRRW